MEICGRTYWYGRCGGGEKWINEWSWSANRSYGSLRMEICGKTYWRRGEVNVRGGWMGWVTSGVRKISKEWSRTPDGLCGFLVLGGTPGTEPDVFRLSLPLARRLVYWSANLGASFRFEGVCLCGRRGSYDDLLWNERNGFAAAVWRGACVDWRIGWCKYYFSCYFCDCVLVWLWNNILPWGFLNFYI